MFLYTHVSRMTRVIFHHQQHHHQSDGETEERVKYVFVISLSPIVTFGYRCILRIFN